MNNEIKEILAYFEKYVKITDMHDSEPMLNWKDIKIVLDYITNLQQENERLVNKLNKKTSVITYNYTSDIYEELEEEKRINEEDLKYIDKLEERIEKAIEYITTEQLYTNYQWGKSQYEKILRDLLNILNGRSDE